MRCGKDINLGQSGYMSYETYEKMNIVCDQKGTTGDVVKPKRGKDIKVFADLSPDVQESIDRMSIIDGKIDATAKANRTAIAINYQHLFPDSYHSTGVAV